MPRLRDLTRRKWISRLLMLWHRIQRAEDPTVSAEPDPASRVPKRPSVRPPKPRRTSRSSSAKNAPLADQLSAASLQSTGVQPDEGIGISRSHPTTAPDQVAGNSGGLALHARPTRRDNMPSYLDDGGVVSLLVNQPSTIGTDSLAMRPSSVDERSHLKLESEPSWGDMSSGMNSNPARAGSGDY